MSFYLVFSYSVNNIWGCLPPTKFYHFFYFKSAKYELWNKKKTVALLTLETIWALKKYDQKSYLSKKITLFLNL